MGVAAYLHTAATPIGSLPINAHTENDEAARAVPCPPLCGYSHTQLHPVWLGGPPLAHVNRPHFPTPRGRPTSRAGHRRPLRAAPLCPTARPHSRARALCRGPAGTARVARAGLLVG